MSRSSGEEQKVEGRDDDTMEAFGSKSERKSAINNQFSGSENPMWPARISFPTPR